MHKKYITTNLKWSNPLIHFMERNKTIREVLQSNDKEWC